MSDPVDMVTLATHGGTAVLGASGVGAFMRWWAGREAQDVATQLALMRQLLDQLVKKAEKSDGLGEKVALLDSAVTAAHKRIDELDDSFDVPRRKSRR